MLYSYAASRSLCVWWVRILVYLIYFTVYNCSLVIYSRTGHSNVSTVFRFLCGATRGAAKDSRL